MSETSPKPAPSRAGAALRWTLLLVLMAVTAGSGYWYWQHSEIYPTTDNAYVHANIVRVAPKVAGPVQRVHVTENTSVEAGDPLFDIDPAPYDAALRSERAFFDQAVEATGEPANALRDAANRLAETRNKLIEARNAVAAARNQEAGQDVPAGGVVNAEQGWRDAVAAFREAQTAYDTEQDKQFDATAEASQLRSAAAALDKAENDRVNAYVDAPSAGWVSGLTLRPGTTVGAGQPLFALVEPGQWWVAANFKETDLTRIRPGQEAIIVLDMYPNMELKGTVESISAGSGATFSALPAENATGNWVKVTQRFAVRVNIANPPAEGGNPLRVGASAHVTVDTTGENQQAAAQ